MPPLLSRPDTAGIKRGPLVYSHQWISCQNRFALVDRVWPQGQASASNTTPVLMLLRWTEQTCDSPVSASILADSHHSNGHCSYRWTWPWRVQALSSCLSMAILANLHAGSSDQVREPTPLITRAGMEMLGQGHQPTSIRHDLPGGAPSNCICFPRSYVLADLSPWVVNELFIPVRSNQPLLLH